MARVALYGRVSGHEQEKSETIETQRFYLEEWAKNNGHQIAGWYGDEDVRSIVPIREREQGGRLLRDAARGAFELVAIYRLGRWSRYAQVWHDGRKQLEAHGVDLVCLNDDLKDDTPGDRLSLGVKLLVTEHERDTIRETCMDGRYRRVQQGGYVGGVVPYGFCVVEDDRNTFPSNERRRRSHLEIDEREAQVVRDIYRWLVEDRLSCRRIALRLNALGIPSPCASAGEGQYRKHMANANGHWQQITVSTIVRNTIYKGQPRFGKESKERETVTPNSRPK